MQTGGGEYAWTRPPWIAGSHWSPRSRPKMVDHMDGIMRWPPVNIFMKVDFRIDSGGGAAAEQCGAHASRPQETWPARNPIRYCPPRSLYRAIRWPEAVKPTLMPGEVVGIGLGQRPGDAEPDEL
jgi:hypothetical protein